MAITKEQIFAAADELDAAGQNPTLAAVRKAVGGGSFTTISEAMSEWRASKTAQAAPMREPAPQAVTDKLAELGADLWGVALEMANTRLAAEREALEGVRVEMEAARQEAAELADQLTVELDETKSRLASIEAAEAAARGEADAQRDELAAMRERVATAEARAGELRTELDHAHTDAAAQRAKLEKAEAHGFGLTDRVNELQALVYEANAELATVKGKAEAADQAHQEQRRAAAQEAHRQAERLTAIQAERDEARRDAATAKEEAATLRGRAQALENMLPASEKKPSGAKKT
jgi:chromosome segregation ATPase